MKKYCHGNYSEIRITALASLAKSQRREVASFKKIFKSLFTHTSFSFGQAKNANRVFFSRN